MGRPDTDSTTALPAGEAGGFCRRLPQVSAHERDFWRRAVAEERERLVLAEPAAAAQDRADIH